MSDDYKSGAASLFASAARVSAPAPRFIPTCQVIIDGQARCLNPAVYRQLAHDGGIVYEVRICADCLRTLQQPVCCPHCFSDDTKPVDNEYGLFQCCQCEEIFTRRTKTEEVLWAGES